MPAAWVAGAAAIGGSLISANASQSAAGQQTSAARDANINQQTNFNQTTQNLSPFLNAGQLSLQQLMQGMGIGPQAVGPTQGVDYSSNLVQNVDGKSFMSNDLQNDPYYRQAWDQIVKGQGGNSQVINPQTLEAQLKAQLQGGQSGPAYGSLNKPFSLQDFQASPAYNFNLDQGTQAINKAAAARGNFYAPSTLQDISKFSQGLASNEYQNAFSNYNTSLNNIYSRLSNLSGSGQNAAVQQGGFAAQAANQMGANTIGAGNAAAAGTVGSANAVNSGIGNAYNAYLMNQILGQNQKGTYGADPNFSGDAAASMAASG